MAIKIKSKDIYGNPTPTTLLKNKINSVEYTNKNLVKHTGAFGETKKVTLNLANRKEDGGIGYEAVYNNSNHNEFYDRTQLVQIEGQSVAYNNWFYKTTIKFDISSLTLAKNFLEKLGVSITYSVYEYTSETLYFSGNTYSVIQPINSSNNGIIIENVVVKENIVSMDISIFQLSLVNGDVARIVYMMEYTAQLSGDYYTENEETVITDNTTKADFTLATNELFQDNSKAGETLANSIIDEYNNGKSTLDLLCIIEDYYDYDTGEKYISANGNINFLKQDNYELFNATYSNGVVSQIEADTPFSPLPSAITNDSNFLSGYVYAQNFDKNLLPNALIGSNAILNYTVDGVTQSLECSVYKNSNGMIGLGIMSTSGEQTPYLPLASSENGGVLGIFLLNTKVDENGAYETVGVGSCLSCIAFGDYAPPNTPLIVVESIEIESSADTERYVFKVEGISNGDIVTSSSIIVNSSKQVNIRFKKDSSYDKLMFKLYGESLDTGISFDVSNMENEGVYCFSANVNIDGGQGNISWDNMSITYGARRKEYDKDVLPMVFRINDEVIPMVRKYDGNDYPMSLNADGTPMVFRVLGVNVFYDGAVLQKLSLQEC